MLPEEKKLRLLLRHSDLKVKSTTWVHLEQPFAIVEFTTGLVEILCCGHGYSELILNYTGTLGKLVVFDLGGEDWVAFHLPSDVNFVQVYEIDNWDVIFKGMSSYKPSLTVNLRGKKPSVYGDKTHVS